MPDTKSPLPLGPQGLARRGEFRGGRDRMAHGGRGGGKAAALPGANVLRGKIVTKAMRLATRKLLRRCED